MITKFILVVGIVTQSGQVIREVPEQVYHETMDQCVEAGDRHFEGRPGQQGAHMMCRGVLLPSYPKGHKI